MQKKNVLLVFTVSVGFNGINVSTIELLRKTDKSRYNFYVLSAVDSLESVEKLFIETGCVFLKEEYRSEHPFKYYCALRKIIRNYHIDIVHAMGNSATLAVEMMAAKKEKVPLRIAHSRNTYCEHSFIDKLLRPFFYSACNCRLACGEAAGKWLFGKRDFTVFKNGKECEKYAFSEELRENFRKRFDCSEATLLIGHVGLFNDQKNHVFIIEIAKELKKLNDDFKFVFIGDGANMGEIGRSVSKNDLEKNVVFAGEVKNVNEYLSAFDVMILPSLYEGLPNVAVEWQINGLPCLISDKVTRECKINDNVYFLPITDASDWARKLNDGNNLRTYDNGIILANVRENGFDLEVNAEKLIAIYDNGI